MLFNFVFMIIFVLVIGMFLVTIVRGLTEWNKNNHSPRLTVDASVVAKRIDVTHSHHSNADGSVHMTSHTHNYVTFQVESGDRMELQTNGSEYGMLAEGDQGRLTFQGTRFLGFERRY